jgi:hypothetical protein
MTIANDDETLRFAQGDTVRQLRLMLPDLKRDGITLYVQHESPGKESNCLPTPNGPSRQHYSTVMLSAAKHLCPAIQTLRFAQGDNEGKHSSKLFL